MPFDLSQTLVVGVASTALFDLSDAERVFQEGGIAGYRPYMREHETEDLSHGTAMPLVQALLKLNEHTPDGEAPLVEVVVMSRNSPETALRVLHNIRRLGLAISRSAFTGGEPVAPYVKAFSVDLFLSTSADDVQKVIDSRACAAALLRDPPDGSQTLSSEEVRLAFDGDAVLFSEKSELVYKAKGLEEFHRVEDQEQDSPLPEGPYARFLISLARLQKRLPMPVETSPVRVSIVTARNAPAEMRVIKTLRAWDVYADAAFFLGGVEKSEVLRAFAPHIFFDDQDVHLDPACRIVPSGKVPYSTNSPLSEAVPEADSASERPSDTPTET